MDFQHRPGAKTGSGGVASWSETNRDRRERLRQLALETIDLAKDPYFMKNHLGSYECKLCLTLHNNEGSYLAHTQGKKHQSNLARRAAKDAKDAPQPLLSKSRVDIRKFVKIGRPGYRVTKQFDQENQQQSLLFQVCWLIFRIFLKIFSYRLIILRYLKILHLDIGLCQHTNKKLNHQIVIGNIFYLRLNLTKR